MCLIGSKGRNSRLTKVLGALRPDICVTSSIDMAEEDFPVRVNSSSPCASNPIAVAEMGGDDGFRPADYVLVTFCKSRLYRQLSASLEAGEGGRLLVVNPNFYHPFLQFGETGRGYADKFREARDLFTFDQDKSVYDLAISVLRPRDDLERIYYQLNELFGRMGRQYLDHVNPSTIRTVIEGGVADGWTSLQFLGSFRDATIYGFEPDRELFESSYCSRFLVDSGRFQFSPLGLWHRSDRLAFAVKKSCTSAVDEETPAADANGIDVISIDEFAGRHDIGKVDFIKLDIEGSELRALQGAKQTIREHRPQLAVCIYHKLEHYYEIPFLLSEYAPDYIFRIGHYSPFHVFSETVLYAIPEEVHGASAGSTDSRKRESLKRNR